MIPFDQDFSEIEAEEFCSAHPRRHSSGPSRSSVGENFRFGSKARGDPEMLSSHARVLDPRGAAGGGAGGDGLLDAHPRRRSRPATLRRPPRCLGRAVPVRGRGRRGRPSAAASLGFPTANIVPDDDCVVPGHGVYAAFANGHPGGGQRRRPPDLRDGPRAAGRGLPDRLRRRPLRRHPAGRLHRAAARREAVRRGRGADRADASATSRTQALCELSRAAHSSRTSGRALTCRRRDEPMTQREESASSSASTAAPRTTPAPPRSRSPC